MDKNEAYEVRNIVCGALDHMNTVAGYNMNPVIRMEVDRARVEIGKAIGMLTEIKENR
jgi:hypothetical protein